MRRLRSVVGGCVLSVLGAILFALGQITLFALFYVLGVVISLVGSGFLWGVSRPDFSFPCQFRSRS